MKRKGPKQTKLVKEKAMNLKIMDWFFSSAKQQPNETRKELSEAILTSYTKCKR